MSVSASCKEVRFIKAGDVRITDCSSLETSKLGKFDCSTDGELKRTKLN